jgi:tRNA 5-methylaminomethyl-2-thiouridine biosynthesis bifunctional protein
MAESAGWERVETDDGSWTLVHPAHGESCHSRAGARFESHQRYVLGCDLPERWRSGGERTWRVLDIGTGLGWNLAATLEARASSELEPKPQLELVTLETSRSVLEAAFELQRAIPQGESLAVIHAALERSLVSGESLPVPVVPGVALSLYLGDARESVLQLADSPGFDAFFLDPFSPRREPGLWAPEFLNQLGRVAAPGARLATYCAATHVRVALALAGWEIGPAPRVGSKAEGTLGARGVPLEPFEPRVERRIARRVAEARSEAGTGEATQ